MRYLKIAPVILAAVTIAAVQPGMAQKQAATAAKPVVNQETLLNKYWNTPDNTVLGTSGSAKVTKAELIKTLWFFDAPNALNYLLNQKLIEQGAKKEGITVTNAQVNAKALETAKTYRFTSIEDLAAAKNLPISVVMNDIRMNLIMEKVGEKKVKVTDADYSEWILARHILINFNKDESDEAKKKEIARKRIDEILQKLKDGGDFAALAKEYSEDPGSKTKGGSLGWTAKGAWVKEFEDAAFALKPGEISAPVESPFGYHIIKVDKIGSQADASEKQELRKNIIGKKSGQAINDWLNDLRKNAKIVNNLQAPKKVIKQTAPTGKENNKPVNDVPENPPTPPAP